MVERALDEFGALDIVVNSARVRPLLPNGGIVL